MKRLLNLNVMGVALLVGAWGVSLGRVALLSREAGELGSDKRVVRMLHWQLEPGYRQALQNVMDEYNQLPHVRQAGVEVVQIAVTERVYEQFLNVHLMSGTAPDICEKGMAQMARGEYTARYFEALGDSIAAPNPYNAPPYLPEDMPPRLAGELTRMPWRETFFDGMQGGWEDRLQNYYAVPTSILGRFRLYYNKPLIEEARRLIQQGLAITPRPDWLDQALREQVVADTPDLRRWAAGDQPPDTLGRLLLTCRAIQVMARQEGREKLVPIAGNSFSHRAFLAAYVVPFTAVYAAALDLDQDSYVSGLETYQGLHQGTWSFNDPPVRALLDCISDITRYFPPGFIGLDREQANRRFILGDAAMVVSGSWDAASLILGAEGRPVAAGDSLNPYEQTREVDGELKAGFRFEVGIMNFPLPAPGERWHEWIIDQSSETGKDVTGGPYAIYQRSAHRAEALDFLRYLTSYRVNQRFNREAGWIPCVIGTHPRPRMKPFMPDFEGIYPGACLNFTPPGQIGGAFSGQFWLFMTDPSRYEQLVAEMTHAVADPRNGLDRLWYEQWVGQRDAVRNLERMLAVESARDLLLDAPDAPLKHARGLLQSVLENNGNNLRQQWIAVNPRRPFPEY